MTEKVNSVTMSENILVNTVMESFITTAL